jgi:hypothetical protein
VNFLFYFQQLPFDLFIDKVQFNSSTSSGTIQYSIMTLEWFASQNISILFLDLISVYVCQAFDKKNDKDENSNKSKAHSKVQRQNIKFYLRGPLLRVIFDIRPYYFTAKSNIPSEKSAFNYCLLRVIQQHKPVLEGVSPVNKLTRWDEMFGIITASFVAVICMKSPGRGLLRVEVCEKCTHVFVQIFVMNGW